MARPQKEGAFLYNFFALLHTVVRRADMRIANIISYILVIVGGLNWGLYGWFDFNLVAYVFGGGRAVGSIVTYSLIAAAALPSSR